MQKPALMQRAKGIAPGGADFKTPDLSKVVPPEMRDAVDRIVAAGQKIMYSPDMRQELMAEVNRDVSMPQKLAEGVVGLVLTLDKQTKGGLPMAAIFPAELELLVEAAGVAKAAGQNVSQQDFNDAAMMVAVLTAQKLGAKDDQIMSEAQKWGGQESPEGEMEPGEGQAHEQGEGADMEQQETQAEAQGLPEPGEEQMRGA